MCALRQRKTSSHYATERGRRRSRFEALEPRTLLSASPTDDSFRLTLFAESNEVPIPAEVGVAPDDSTQSLFTIDDGGEIYLDAPGGQKLGDFFDIWRNHGGVAGNNPDAFFDSDQLMGYAAAGQNTVQMFVNGQVSKEYADYAVEDGDEIVLVYGDNPVLSVNTNFGPIVTELFERETPGTVANFLNYVNDGDYVNSIFHRSVPGFVIQGGGFTTDSELFTSVSQLTEVPTDAEIPNEPGISNVRGTIAMAKLGGNPHSATSQFFINLADNSANLDNQNGGFTVFGQVLDMATVDVLDNLPINPFHPSPFDALPYQGVVNAGRFLTQLVVVQSVVGQGEISGTAYLDANKNGEHDSSEQPLAGATVYLDANDNGSLDLDERSIETGADGSYLLQVEPGIYTVRSEATGGRVQTQPAGSDSYEVTVEIGRERSDIDFGQSTPLGVDLAATSDTGIADDDNLTQKNNVDQAAALEFLVSGVAPGIEVQIRTDGTTIGSVIPTEDTVNITTDGTTELADGVHSITAVQVLGGSTDESAPLEVTVDATPSGGVTNDPPASVEVGEPYSFDAASPEEGNVSYAVAGAPAGLTIDASTGEIAWTPSDSQIGSSSFDLVIEDDAGNTTSEAVSVTVLPAIEAVELGRIDFRRLESVAPGNGDLWWRLETARAGWLTVQSSHEWQASELTLELYPSTDSTTPLVQSSAADALPRVDWSVEGGEAYLLRASGSATGVTLMLANLVDENGDAVSVYGTAGNDEFVFDASASREIAINGVAYPYEDTSLTAVTFDGGEGRDVAWLFDSAGDEIVEAWPDRATFVNGAADGVSDYAVEVVGVENLLSYATAGGNDSAIFHGSADGLLFITAL